MAKRRARRLLFIGWDAADWKVINPLMDAGLMPTLEHLVNGGTIANLATLDPPLSPMLWTSIATGKTADQHGILGFVEPTPEGTALRPVLGTSRKCKAFWNILNQQGFKGHVVGWWPSHPAEPINGVMVSNLYHKVTAKPGEPWPLAPGTVHPSHLEQTLAELRVHPAELTAAHILPFVPRAAEVDQDTDQRLISVAKIIADMATVHAAATWAMEHEDWDYMAVYYDAIDHFGHGFMRYHPPRRPGVSQERYDLYNNVITAGYRFHDMMLHRLLDLAGPDTTVLLCSDHGFHPDHLRPQGIPHEPAGPAHEHREYGIFCLSGPGIRKDERIYGASLLDLAPTVLTLFDLPIGRDMNGKPLVQVFEEAVAPDFIESWEDIDGDAGMHLPDVRRDPWAEREAMKQLIELGYIEAPEENIERAIAKNQRESQFYLARTYLFQGKRTEALPVLEQLYADAPDQLRYGLRLAECYLDLGRVPEAREVAETEMAIYKQQVEAKKQQHLEQAKEAGLAPPEAPQKQPYDAGLHVLIGTLALAEGKQAEALEHLRRAERVNPRFPRLHLRIGDVYLKQKQWEDAERAFMKALTIDPDNAAAHHGLAITYLHRRRFEETVEACLRAVGLHFYFPAAHYHLGEALMRLGKHALAADAFEVCVAQEPGIKQAHFWLSELYRIHLNAPKKAGEHLRFATEQIVDS